MSRIADGHAGPQLNPFNVRAAAAGGGATASLVAAALIAFLAIATLVAFNGLPFGLGGGDAGAVSIAEPPTNAPEAAALAAGSVAPAAVAATPATASAVAPDPATQGGGAGGSGGGNEVGGPPAPPGSSSPPGSNAPSSGGDAGVVGGTVGALDRTTGNLGVDLSLGETTQGITQPLDRTVNQTLNGVGGLLGNPKLGDNVNSNLSGLTGKLLP